MSRARFAALEELEAKLDWLCDSPRDGGPLTMIVVRPAKNQRVLVNRSEVSPDGGVDGDNWTRECWRTLNDGRPDPDVQVTMMNSRLISLLAPEAAAQAMAGDQLYADLDLSETNLPVGQRLAIGTAVFEVTPEPHTGCRKFGERFGAAALKFISRRDHREMRFRGVYLKVVAAGSVSVGDALNKL